MSMTRQRAATLGLLLIALLGFSAAGSAQAQEATPERVRTAVAQLDSVVADVMERSGVPGLAVAVVYKNEVISVKGYGVREAGASAPVDADTVFQLASLSKPIASTVVASVVGDGLVSWDDPIVDHDPGFQMYTPWVTSQVTLRDMFAHRSGLPEHAGDLLEDIGYDREQVLHRLRYQKPASSLRSEYAYTNFGLTEAAVAAANAAGMTWEDLADERLYQPLGMTSTSSRYADFLAAPNRALGHVRVDGQWVAKYSRDADAQSPAGGVSSSVHDMAKWLRLQLAEGMFDGQQVVDATALGETHAPQIVNNPAEYPTRQRSSFYGLGWNVSFDEQGRVRLGHSGAFSLGAGTTVNLVPAEELGIVVLANAAPIGAAESVALSFLDLALTGSLERDYLTLVTPTFVRLAAPTYGTTTDYSTPPANPTPSLPLDAYAGTYQNDFFGDIEITVENGELVLHAGPDKMPFPMKHWDRDVFLYQPSGENAYGLSGVSFQIGPDQSAAGVLIEYFDIHGQGSFTKAPSTE
jgi:CubicO group peptidase (beta-lactamase class C family)